MMDNQTREKAIELRKRSMAQKMKKLEKIMGTANTITYRGDIKFYTFLKGGIKDAIGTSLRMKFKRGYILTYSLPDFEEEKQKISSYTYRLFSTFKGQDLTVIVGVGGRAEMSWTENRHRLLDIKRVVDQKKVENVERWARVFPEIEFYTTSYSHVKLYAFDNGKVIFGSSNLSSGASAELIGTVTSKKIYKELVEKIIQPILKNSKRINKSLSNFM